MERKSMSMLRKVVGPTTFPSKAEVVIARVTSGTPQSKPLITLYVRRGDDISVGAHSIKTRTISLNPIPDKLSMDDLLHIGFAFDGDSLSVGITPYTDAVWEAEGIERHDFDDIPGAQPRIRRGKVTWTLADALNSVQSVLVKWLRSLGYEVKIS